MDRVRKDSRIICQYDLQGKLVAQFFTLAEAIRSTGIMSIRKCLIKERRQAGGYKWAYLDDGENSVNVKSVDLSVREEKKNGIIRT